MEKLYLGDPNDAEVDALLSQLNDENLLKLSVNTHTSASGFEYPTFTDGWSNAEDDTAGVLDTQLQKRFANLKAPIPSAKKGKDSNVVKKAKESEMARKGKDSEVAKHGKDLEVPKKAKDSELAKKPKDWEVAKNGKDSEVPKKAKDSKVAKKQKDRDVAQKDCDAAKKNKDSLAIKESKDSQVMKKGKNSDVAKGKEVLKDDAESLRMSTSKKDDSSTVKGDGSIGLSQRTEYLSFRSDDLEDLDSIDSILNERFRALKVPSPLRHKNAGLDNLLQFSGQLSDYEGYASALSTPCSPSANLLGRSKSRSSPRPVNSVSTACHCSAPSPLKLLKQVSSKTFPSKTAALPPISTSSRSTPSSSSSDRTPRKISEKSYKVEGFGNFKQAGKENVKGKRRGSDDDSLSTMKDVRSLLASVADRVGFERSRVSSAEVDDFLEGDLHAWSVLEREKEFAKASSEEEKLNREAERVVEWAKDAARLGMEVSDADSEAEDLEPGDVDERSSDGSLDTRFESDKQFKIVKAKKKWGLF